MNTYLVLPFFPRSEPSGLLYAAEVFAVLGVSRLLIFCLEKIPFAPRIFLGVRGVRNAG